VNPGAEGRPRQAQAEAFSIHRDRIDSTLKKFGQSIE